MEPETSTKKAIDSARLPQSVSVSAETDDEEQTKAAAIAAEDMKEALIEVSERYPWAEVCRQASLKRRATYIRALSIKIEGRTAHLSAVSGEAQK